MYQTPAAELNTLPKPAFEQASDAIAQAVSTGEAHNDFTRGTITVDANQPNVIPGSESSYGFPVKCSISSGEDQGATEADMLQLLDVRFVPDTLPSEEARSVARIRDRNPDITHLLVGRNFDGMTGFKALRPGEKVVWGRNSDTIGSRFGLMSSSQSKVSGYHAEVSLDVDGAVKITDLGSTNGTSVTKGVARNRRGRESAQLDPSERYRTPVREVVGKVAVSAQVGHVEKPAALQRDNTPQPRPVLGERSVSAAEIDKIITSIEDGAVYGKFPVGTAVRMGNLPEFAASHPEGGRGDYATFPRDSILNNARVLNGFMLPLAVRTAKMMSSRQGFNPPHCIAVAPLGGTLPDGRPNDRAIVDYMFGTDHVDGVGRPARLIHVLTLMPKASASRLKELIASDPDAAEYFFQHVAAGLESTEGSDARRNGVGRVRSDEVVVTADWDFKAPPIKLDSRSNDGYAKQPGSNEWDKGARSFRYQVPHGTVVLS